MNKNSKVKPGGDKNINRLRFVGQVLESVAISLGKWTLGIGLTGIGVGFITDKLIKINKRKLSEEGRI